MAFSIHLESSSPERFEGPELREFVIDLESKFEDSYTFSSEDWTIALRRDDRYTIKQRISMHDTDTNID